MARERNIVFPRDGMATVMPFPVVAIHMHIPAKAAIV